MTKLIATIILSGIVIQSPDLEKVRKDIQSINTRKQAQAYLDKSRLKGDLLELDQIKDSSVAALRLFKAKNSEVIEQRVPDKIYFYKTLTITELPADRVQYIFFDNSRIAKDKIDSLRNVIMKRLKDGDTFAALAREYSMDPSGKRGGDLGWYDPSMMIKEFVSAVRGHAKGDVFMVDAPSNKWYYVVRKSHDSIKRKKIVAFYVAVPEK